MFEQVEELVKKQPLAGKMTLAELEAELGTDPDWPKIKASRELTIGYAKSIHIMRQVRAGQTATGGGSGNGLSVVSWRKKGETWGYLKQQKKNFIRSPYQDRLRKKSSRRSN